MLYPDSGFSGRAGFKDLDPSDGGWSLYPMGTVLSFYMDHYWNYVCLMKSQTIQKMVPVSYRVKFSKGIDKDANYDSHQPYEYTCKPEISFPCLLSVK